MKAIPLTKSAVSQGAVMSTPVTKPRKRPSQCSQASLSHNSL